MKLWFLTWICCWSKLILCCCCRSCCCCLAICGETEQGKFKSVLQSQGKFPWFCVTKFNMTLIKLMKIDVPTPLQDQQFILKSDQTRYFDLGNSYVSFGLKQMKSKTRQQWSNPIWNARVSKIPLSGNLVRRYCLWHLQPLGKEKNVTHPPVYETESRGAPSIKRCCIL